MAKGDFQRNRTHCKYGHEYTEETVKYNSKGHRICLICRSDYKAKNRDKLREYQRNWKRNNRNGTKEYNDYMSGWRKKNPEKAKAINSKSRSKDPQKHRNHSHSYYERNREKELKKSWERHIKTEYGLSSEDYENLLNSQDNRCAICNKTPDSKRLSIDHNHESGSNRGLLCDKCNFLIGLAQENPSILIIAANYLQQHTKLSIDYSNVVPTNPLIRLNPSIPVEIVENDLNIPTGDGYAIGWIDYSEEHHLLWIVILNDNRQCWQVPNPYIRSQSNVSLGRK